MSVVTTIPGGTSGSPVPVPPSLIPLPEGEILLGNGSDVAEAATLTNGTGGDEDILVVSGQSVKAKSLIAGTNVSFSSDGDTITVNASGGGGASGLVYDALDSDQNLSATPAALCSVTLGAAGKYLVNIRVCENLSNITAMTSARRSYFYLELSGDGQLSSSVFNGTRPSVLVAAIVGITLHTTGIAFVIEPTTDNQTLTLNGALNNAAGITGDWVVTAAEGVEDTSLQAIKIG